MSARGEMPEWPNGIDSKSIVAAMPPRVRIPVSPPFIKPNLLIRLGFLFLCVFQYAIGYAITCWLGLHKSGFLWTGTGASSCCDKIKNRGTGNVSLKFSVPLPVRAGDSMPRRSTSTLWPLALIVIVLSPFSVHATDCTYRKDSLGTTRYQCKEGKTGTLRTDSLGNVRDSGTGTTWRKDSLGNVRGSDGTTYRQDSLGNVRGSNATSGERVTWRKDSLGTLRASDGSVCRTDSLGTLRCDGSSTPPTVLQAK